MSQLATTKTKIEDCTFCEYQDEHKEQADLKDGIYLKHQVHSKTVSGELQRLQAHLGNTDDRTWGVVVKDGFIQGHYVKKTAPEIIGCRYYVPQDEMGNDPVELPPVAVSGMKSAAHVNREVKGLALPGAEAAPDLAAQVAAAEARAQAAEAALLKRPEGAQAKYAPELLAKMPKEQAATLCEIHGLPVGKVAEMREALAAL